MTEHSVTVLIAATDETYLLKETIEIICSECSPKDICEIIVLFKDNSNIDGQNIVKNAKDKFPDYGIVVKIQDLPGFSESIYFEFLKAKGTHIVAMVADMEMDPHALKTFIEVSKQNPHILILASRWIKGAQVDGYKWLRTTGVWFLRYFFRVILKTKITDATFPYILFPKELFHIVNYDSPKDFIWDRYYKPIYLGVETIEVPIHYVQRKKGRRNYKISDLFSRAFYLLGIAYRVRKTQEHNSIRR